MIIATVTTCPQRWNEYQRLRRNFEELQFPFALRTFQTGRHPDDPRANTNLNARAAAAFALRHLPEEPGSWLFYLEDDVHLFPALREVLPVLAGGPADCCWYLCTRANPIHRQYRHKNLLVNELDEGVVGIHALLIPRHFLPPILSHPWGDIADACLFAALRAAGAGVKQVADPPLVEHAGTWSTYAGRGRMNESLYANRANCYRA